MYSSFVSLHNFDNKIIANWVLNKQTIIVKILEVKYKIGIISHLTRSNFT